MKLSAHCHRAGYAIYKGIATIWQQWQTTGRRAAAIPATAHHPRWWNQRQCSEVREPTTRNPPTGRIQAATPKLGCAERGGRKLGDWQRRVLRYCVAGPATGRELLVVAGYAQRTGNFKRGLLKLRGLELLEFSIPDQPRSKRQRYRLTLRGQQYLARQ